VQHIGCIVMERNPGRSGCEDAFDCDQDCVADVIDVYARRQLQSGFGN
jgi:hypothetical protein